MQTIDFMPDHLNAEPTVFRGFTTHEMFAAAGVGCVGGSVISIPLLPLAGWVILPTGALIMPLLVVFFGGTFLTRIKRWKTGKLSLPPIVLETANRVCPHIAADRTAD